MLDHRFIINSPGRTGSILIASALSDVLKKEIKYIDDTKVIDDNDWIVHNHNPNLVIPNKSDWVLIVSHRRDKFKGVISYINAEITNEYSKYSNRKFLQKYIPVETFARILRERYIFYNETDRIGYAKVVDIYLEDMLKYPYHLFEKLGQNIKMPILTEKCPYEKELISNFDELEEYYQNRIGSLTI
jgi:hypothetical protein